MSLLNYLCKNVYRNRIRTLNTITNKNDIPYGLHIISKPSSYQDNYLYRSYRYNIGRCRNDYTLDKYSIGPAIYNINQLSKYLDRG